MKIDIEMCPNYFLPYVLYEVKVFEILKDDCTRVLFSLVYKIFYSHKLTRI